MATLAGRAAIGRFALAGVAGLLLALSELVLAFALGGLLRTVALKADPSRSGFASVFPGVSSPALLLLVAALLRAGLQGAAQATSSSVGIGVSQRLRVLALDAALENAGGPDGPVVAGMLRFVDQVPRVSQFFQLGALLSTQVLQVMGLGVLFCVLAPNQAGWLLLAIATCALPVWGLGRRVRAAAAKILPAQRRVVASLERVLRNLTLLRTLRMQHVERSRIGAEIAEHGAVVGNATRAASVTGALASALGACVLVAMVGMLSRLTLAPSLAVVLLYLTTRLLLLLGAASSTLSSMSVYRPALAHVLSDLRLLDAAPHAVGEPGRRAPGAANVAAVASPARVRFSSVSFRYPGTARDVLDAVSFEIPEGSLAAIVGPSGSGKSTLVQLLLGLIEPTAGTVTVDGVSPSELFGQNGGRVGYVGAEPFVFAGTVRENLVYGARHAVTVEQIERVLRDVALGGVVAALPSGLEHVLGEQGEGLSSGEKQRLGLARALLAEPQILVLDEATVNLDGATEQIIVETLRGRRGKVTTVVCAHRSSILDHCEPVITLRPVGASGSAKAVMPGVETGAE